MFRGGFFFEFAEAFLFDIILPFRLVEIIETSLVGSEIKDFRLFVNGAEHIVCAGADNGPEIVAEPSF